MTDIIENTHRQIIVYNKDIGHAYGQNLNARVINDDGGYYIKTNSLGFRSNIEFEKKKEKKRILIFGDSNTAADGVSNDDRFSDIVGRHFDAEIYNFAISGTGTDQQYLIWEKYAKDIEADLIVIGSLVENIERNKVQYRESINSFTKKRTLTPKPFFLRKNEKLVLKNNPVPRFNENIEDIVGENPLPMGGRFDISKDYQYADEMQRIVQQIRRMEGVDVASFQHGVISRVDSVIENILGISMILGIIIFIVSVVQVSNTIRLIIHTKQETIETLHLLGATNSFIRFPLVIEGIIQGMLGAGFSLFILYLLSSFKEYLLEPLIHLPITTPSNLIEYNFIFGLLLALIGSIRGISKYLPK